MVIIDIKLKITENIPLIVLRINYSWTKGTKSRGTWPSNPSTLALPEYLLVTEVEGLSAPVAMQLQDGDEVSDGGEDG